MCVKNIDSDSVDRELLPPPPSIFIAQDVYKYTRVNLYIIVLVYTYAFHFLFSVLNSMFAACRQNFAEVARTT